MPKLTPNMTPHVTPRPSAVDGTAGALDGLRVLHLAANVSAGWCARVLADFGADVLTVEPPGGSALRRLAPFDDSGNSIPAAYVLANQRAATLDLARPEDRRTLERLVTQHDVVIEGRFPGVLDTLDLPFAEIERRRPGVILTSVTPHGRTGPMAGLPGNDLTAFARSGWAAINGPPGRPPLKGVGFVGSYLAGVHGALATLAALRHRRRTGEGQIVDVAEADVLASVFAPVAAQAAYMGLHTARHTLSWEDPFGGPIPVADGYFVMLLGQAQFFRDAMTALGLSELADDERFGERAYRAAHADAFVPRVRELVATRSKMELFETLTTLRVTAGPVLTVGELAADPHLAERGVYVRPGDDPAAPRILRLPVRMSATPPTIRRPAPAAGPAAAEVRNEAHSSGGAPEPASEAAAAPEREQTATPERAAPLDGIRVLALTQVWAGSVCAQLLALLGAEVIKIEARRRPDSWRGTYSFPIPPEVAKRSSARNGWNCHPSFNVGNLGQQGVTLDLQRPEGIEIFRRLLVSTDVVVENFTPRVLTNLGIGFESLREHRPDVILCSISGYGQSGPYRNRPSNGGTIEPASGTSSLLGWPDGPPRNSGAMLPDPIGAAWAATAILAALHHRDASGEGQHIDISLQEANLAMIGDAALEYELTGHERPRLANRHTTFAPHGIYPAAGDDRWIALAAEDEEQWARLCDIAEQPRWTADPRFAGNDARKQHEDALDDALSTWTSTQPHHELAGRLLAAGVPAAPVLFPAEVIDHPTFRQRGVVATVTHPEAGTWSHPVIPSRLDRTPARARRAAPCLGEHSAEVFERLAGVSAERYAELVRMGITGTTPPD